MATIGTFTKQDGSFVGSLATLTVKTKVTISPIDKMGEKAPDYRVYAANAEIGAAWSRWRRATPWSGPADEGSRSPGRPGRGCAISDQETR